MADELYWKDLEIFKKTSKTYEIRITRDGVAEPISGWTFYFTVKVNMADTDANAKIKKDVTEHVDAAGGKTLIELTPTDTDITATSYWYDIKYVDDCSNSGVLFRGRLKISETVTQRA